MVLDKSFLPIQINTLTEVEDYAAQKSADATTDNLKLNVVLQYAVGLQVDQTY